MTLRSWYTVYGALENGPSPLTLFNAIKPPIDGLIHRFEPDNEQWRSGQFRLSGSAGPALLLARERRGEEGFLEKLKKAEQFARELGDKPNCDLVLEHIRRTQQVVHLVPCAVAELGARRLAKACEQLCGPIVRPDDGVILVYQAGFFGAKGESLLPYNRRHNLRTR
jgi:hypothetical protein